MGDPFFYAQCWKMTKLTLKIVRCLHRNISKVDLAIFENYALSHLNMN